MTNKPEWLFVGFAAVVVICVTVMVLAAKAAAVPSWFADVAVFSLGGGSGVALPRVGASSGTAAPPS